MKTTIALLFAAAYAGENVTIDTAYASQAWKMMLEDNTLTVELIATREDGWTTEGVLMQ